MERENNFYKYLPSMEPSMLSLNDYIISDVGVGMADYDEYKYKRGKDIYSFELLIKETREKFEESNSQRDRDIVRFLSEKMANRAGNYEKVYSIIDHIAIGMAMIFHTLCKGSKLSRESNHLTEADWTFWKNCSNIFIVGGLAEGQLGKCLEQRIGVHLKKLGESGISVRCFSNQNIKSISLLGCSKADIGYENTVYVFDFGNTSIKCGKVTNSSDCYIIDERPIIIHQDYSKLNDNLQTAKGIHFDIVRCIKQTIEYYHDNQTVFYVSLCIANNVTNNKIMDRGNYRSLRHLADSYDNYLKQSLEQVLGKRVVIHIMNDAQAVANLFKEWSPKAAVVTLGTQMGIAYP